jgi:hypothetical protein
LDTSTSQAISSLIETLHAETTASAVANAHVPLLEASPLPSLGGDPRGDFSDHASWSMLNPQPLPPGPGEARSLHNAIFGHAGDAGIIVVGGHDASTSLHDQTSWSALNPQPLPPMPSETHDSMLASAASHETVDLLPHASTAMEFSHTLHTLFG